MLLSCTFTATLGIFFSVKKEQKDLHTHTHTLLIIQEEMNKTLCHTINWVLLGRVGWQILEVERGSNTFCYKITLQK